MGTKQTPEQIAEAKAVKTAEAAAVKQAKAAEAAAAKEAKAALDTQAKAVKDAAKAAVNNDAAKAEKAEKAAKAAEAKAVKDAEKVAKAAAAAKAKADKAAAKEANKMPTQNGVVRPKSVGACGRVWALADAMSAHFKQAVPIKELLAAGAALADPLNEATIKTQYARWKAFNGITGQVLALPVAA